MATLRDTTVHGSLGVIEDITLLDYQYNVVRGEYQNLIYGQTGVATTIYGSQITETATNYVLIDSRFRVSSTNYGTAAPTTSTPGNYTGEVYFRIVS